MSYLRKTEVRLGSSRALSDIANQPPGQPLARASAPKWGNDPAVVGVSAKAGAGRKVDTVAKAAR